MSVIMSAHKQKEQLIFRTNPGGLFEDLASVEYYCAGYDADKV